MSLLRSVSLGMAALLFAGLGNAATITVTYSEDFSEKLVEDYGEREGEHLSAQIIRDLEEELARREVEASRIAVVIEDAKPNRPTFQQLGDNPSLDPIRSISIGGMRLTGIAYGEDGEVIAEMDYDYYENNIRDVIGVSTWWDARRASDRFANRLVREINTP